MAKYVSLLTVFAEDRELSYEEWTAHDGGDDYTCVPDIQCPKDFALPNLNPNLVINKLTIKYQVDPLGGDRYAMVAAPQYDANGNAIKSQIFDDLGFGVNSTIAETTFTTDCIVEPSHDKCRDGKCEHLVIPRLVKQCYERPCWSIHASSHHCKPIYQVATSIPITDGLCAGFDPAVDAINPNTGNNYYGIYVAWKNIEQSQDSISRNEIIPISLNKVECNNQLADYSQIQNITTTWLYASDVKGKGYWGHFVV